MILEKRGNGEFRKASRSGARKSPTFFPLLLLLVVALREPERETCRASGKRSGTNVRHSLREATTATNRRRFWRTQFRNKRRTTDKQSFSIRRVLRAPTTIRINANYGRKRAWSRCSTLRPFVLFSFFSTQKFPSKCVFHPRKPWHISFVSDHTTF